MARLRRPARELPQQAALPRPTARRFLAYGKAVRYPTVSELFQGTLSGNAIVNNNPDLKPEIDQSLDLALTRHLDHGHWRISLYQDRIADSLYSQTDITVSPTVTSVQNIDRTRGRGVEGEDAARQPVPAGQRQIFPAHPENSRQRVRRLSFRAAMGRLAGCPPFRSPVRHP